ncbi:helix-turn-helix transcriptional regulator [Salinirubellus sp. GCM10025818]|uniref:helix-turn-helix transcriptional regulator n=1 Tax=Salinirubellus TaxID=2162630 RepID=UPI0030D0AD38
MNGGESEVPAQALEDVAYLTRSANRVKILGALTDRSASRRELAEITGTSRTTLDRIVNELEDRGWAERTPDGTYTATPEGTRLQRQFRPFLESVVAVRNLGKTVEWLPTEELTIGLEHFADAIVQRPEGDDPVETIDLMVEMVEEATRHRAFTHLVPPEPLSEAILEGVESGRLTAEGVLTTGSLDFLRETPRRRGRWASIVEAGAGLYQYDGEIPCNLWIMDENVLIKKSRPEPFAEAYGVPIISRDEDVRSWANQLIDTYRAEATRLEPGYFAESAP